MIDLLICLSFLSMFVLFFWLVSKYGLSQSQSWQDLTKYFATEIEPTKENSINLKIRNYRIDGSEGTSGFHFYKMEEGLLLSVHKFIRGKNKNVLIPW